RGISLFYPAFVRHMANYGGFIRLCTAKSAVLSAEVLTKVGSKSSFYLLLGGLQTHSSPS
ncbi:hypothetical protein K9L63_03860, partial [Candidatus Gracilibacteria bacterium]|nr:hypothetical protein [Candidatus Gracilibacteria bacterium]